MTVTTALISCSIFWGSGSGTMAGGLDCEHTKDRERERPGERPGRCVVRAVGDQTAMVVLSLMVLDSPVKLLTDCRRNPTR
jgi:hypothetical protein